MKYTKDNLDIALVHAKLKRSGVAILLSAVSTMARVDDRSKVLIDNEKSKLEIKRLDDVISMLENEIK